MLVLISIFFFFSFEEIILVVVVISSTIFNSDDHLCQVAKFVELENIYIIKRIRLPNVIIMY